MDSANYRRAAVTESLKMDKSTIESFLGLLRPRLQYLLGLAKQVQIIDMMTDLAGSEGEMPQWFSHEQREVVKNAQSIRADFKVSSSLNLSCMVNSNTTIPYTFRLPPPYSIPFPFTLPPIL